VKTRNGRGFYAYSGGQTGGVGAVTLIDIANVGLDDLLATIYMTADWTAVSQSLGFSIDVDGLSVAYNAINVASATTSPGPQQIQIIIPAQTAFAVVSSHDGASGGALRSAVVIAFPLLIPGG